MPPIKTVLVGAMTVVGVAALLWRHRSPRRSRARGVGTVQDRGESVEAKAEEKNMAAAARQTVGISEPIAPRWPEGARERRQFVARLDGLYVGSGESRLRAMALAREWGHPLVLPLVRRGLRDVSPAVMREAAVAIESFRGGPPPTSNNNHPPTFQLLDGPITETTVPRWRLPNPLPSMLEKGFRLRNGYFLPRGQPNSPPRSVARTR